MCVCVCVCVCVHEQRSTEFGTHFYRETKQNSAAAASKMPQKKNQCCCVFRSVCVCVCVCVIFGSVCVCVCVCVTQKTSAAASLEVCACDAARGALDTCVTQYQPRRETVLALQSDFLLFFLNTHEYK